MTSVSVGRIFLLVVAGCGLILSFLSAVSQSADAGDLDANNWHSLDSKAASAVAENKNVVELVNAAKPKPSESKADAIAKEKHLTTKKVSSKNDDSTRSKKYGRTEVESKKSKKSGGYHRKQAIRVSPGQSYYDEPSSGYGSYGDADEKYDSRPNYYNGDSSDYSNSNDYKNYADNYRNYYGASESEYAIDNGAYEPQAVDSDKYSSGYQSSNAGYSDYSPYGYGSPRRRSRTAVRSYRAPRYGRYDQNSYYSDSRYDKYNRFNYYYDNGGRSQYGAAASVFSKPGYDLYGTNDRNEAYDRYNNYYGRQRAPKRRRSVAKRYGRQRGGVRYDSVTYHYEKARPSRRNGHRYRRRSYRAGQKRQYRRKWSGGNKSSGKRRYRRVRQHRRRRHHQSRRQY